MAPAPRHEHHVGSVARRVAVRVTEGGERFWKLADFNDLPAGAVARSLSRLSADGQLRRVQRGVYWRGRNTVLGQSVPSAGGVVAAAANFVMHPAGLAAANHLGLTTQNPMRPELATPATAAPKSAHGFTVHLRRPASRAGLASDDAAILEVLRDRGRTSDLEPKQTTKRIMRLLSDPDRYRRLAAAAATEPPRVRAILGALGEQAGVAPEMTTPLRQSLNPLSRFDFGAFTVLPNARAWQAKR